METPELLNLTPEEASEWPLRYVNATEVKVGDYLIRQGEFKKVQSVRTFEPYAAVQIKAGGVNYASNNAQNHWVLQKP